MSKDRTHEAGPDHELTMKRLWGMVPRGRRGPKRALDVTDIVDAALELADSGGLRAVSMARVAEALGCSVMALYRHVTSKDELIAFLADRVAADAQALGADLDWRAALRRWTQLQVEGVLAHPWVLDLPLAALPLGPHRARWLDQGFAAMRTLNLPLVEKGLVLSLLSQHVLAEARVLAELQGVTTNPYADLSVRLSKLAEHADMPYLFAALAAVPVDTADGDFGINLILDGVEARVRRRIPLKP